MRYRVVRLGPGRIVVALLAVLLLWSSASYFADTVAVSAGKRSLPIYSVETSETKMSLGFNCAWDNTDIPELIEILGRYDVKATFFVSGSWCKKYPESVKALYDAGHEIGSHSNTHADMATLNKTRLVEEITRCNDKIQAITGQETKLFRMPSGSYNDLVIETILEQGMIPIQWDCDSLDYKNPSPEEMRARITKKLRPGSITLFHSGAKNTPAALPSIIEVIQSTGYEIVTISDLIWPPPYTLDYEGRQHKG